MKDTGISLLGVSDGYFSLPPEDSLHPLVSGKAKAERDGPTATPKLPLSNRTRVGGCFQPNDDPQRQSRDQRKKLLRQG
jgi:hypothetical protein